MATKRRVAIPEDLVEVFDEVEQNSEEWRSLRLGMPTASRFGALMASSDEMKTRTKLLHELAGEILTGEPAETYENEAMRRGRAMEAEALQHYAFTRDAEVRRVGFVRRTIRDPLHGDLVVGCSPDGLVGDDGLLQVKTMRPDLLVELVDRGRFPTEHKWQCHGELWVTGRRWCDLMVFCRGMPGAPPTFRIERNELTIAELRRAVEVFRYDLATLVERVRAKGGAR